MTTVEYPPLEDEEFSVLKAGVADRLDGLEELSRAVHSASELAFQEHLSADLIQDHLNQLGFSIEAGSGGLETAFVARFGSGPLVISFCAEYDALPGIGHACGHNLIAATSTGAAEALALLADQLAVTVQVIGCPAEEGGGGKQLLLDAGVFDTSHAALMVHPWPEDFIHLPCLAVGQYTYRFHGRAAHAAAYPHLGRNAADALTISQVAVGLLRQHIRSCERIHGYTELAGEAANIVPDRAIAHYMIRSDTKEGLDELTPRVHRCFEAGALATDTSLERKLTSPVYTDLTPDLAIEAAFRRAGAVVGRDFLEPEPGTPGISTDMGNLSRVLPAIHPMLGIDSNGAVNHTAGFTAACIGPDSRRAIHDGSLLLALTGAELARSQRDRLLGRPGAA